MSDANKGAGHAHRGDIDGLRAIAIISVVAFHAFPVKVTGGFVGVDIFFVISGYLISQGIVDRLQGPGGFSLVDFYIRRIGRIFPALVTVMIATLAAGWYILLPDEFRQLALHAESAAGFAQNFVLWSESGYFDNVADTKPFLHLWSLAIEEQFYILWPLWLMAAWKARSRLLLWSAVLALLSFAVNMVLVQVDRTADFYSPLSRFWELMIGALLAQLLRERNKPGAAVAASLSVTGLVLIVGSVALFDTTTRFPGWLALLPTLGTAAIIAAGNASWINRAVLGCRPMVWVGLISYPLYLWHWPVLSMLRIYTGDLPPATWRLVAVAASVALAWLTYRYVEIPVRFRMPTARRIGLCLGAMGGVFLMGLAGTTGTIVARNDAAGLEQIALAVGDREFPKNLKRMVVAPKGVYYLNSDNPNTTLFIGDSHIEHYTPRIIQTMTQSGGLANTSVFVTAPGCPPVRNVYRTTASCDEARDFALGMIDRPEVKTVVLGGCWNCYFIAQHDDDFYVVKDGVNVSLQKPEGIDLALASLEQQLKSMVRPDKKLYLALDNPQGPEFNPRSLLLGSRLEKVQGAASDSTVEIDPRTLVLRQRLLDMAARLHIEVLDPMDMVCIGKRCTRVDADGLPIFSDDNHLRPHFVKARASFIDKTLFSGRVMAGH